MWCRGLKVSLADHCKFDYHKVSHVSGYVLSKDWQISTLLLALKKIFWHL